MKRPSIPSTLIGTLTTSLLALPFIIPFAWLISTSFKAEADIFRVTLEFIPHSPTLENFRRVLADFPFAIYIRNTIIITLGTVLGSIASSAPVAYACSKLEWPDRKLVFALLMLTMMIPPQVTMIPVFLIFRQLGWINTFLPLIVPAFLANAFFVFLLRQFFLSFPNALIESARMDGAIEPRILISIVMPLCKPALLTVALFAGMGAWNDFLMPLIYLSSESKKTLALGLQNLVGQHGSQWGMLMAGSLLMALPIFILFLVAQRHFIQGIAMSGLKG